MSTFQVGNLPGQGAFGALVTQLTPRSLDDPQTRKARYELWIEKGVIVFKELTGLDGPRGVPPGERRRMRRTTIAGEYALGRREARAP